MNDVLFCLWFHFFKILTTRTNKLIWTAHWSLLPYFFSVAHLVRIRLILDYGTYKLLQIRCYIRSGADIWTSVAILNFYTSFAGDTWHLASFYTKPKMVTPLIRNSDPDIQCNTQQCRNEVRLVNFNLARILSGTQIRMLSFYRMLSRSSLVCKSWGRYLYW